MASNNRSNVRYVYDLPYFERKELCRILDHNEKWEELGGKYMNFDVMTIHYLRQSIIRGKSPTDELLTMWGHQNHTVAELFVLLSRMQHYQSMLTLKPFVDPKFHRVIYEGEENLQGLFNPCTVQGGSSVKKPSNFNLSNVQPPACSSFSSQNANYCLSPQPAHSDSQKNMAIGRHNLNMPESSLNQTHGKSTLREKPSSAANNNEEKILNTVRPPLMGLPASNEENANVPSVSPTQGLLAEVRAPPDEKENNIPPPDSHHSPTKASDVAEANCIEETKGAILHISYKELVVATNLWDKATILGKGGFGTVFKGTWKNTLVAIKRIEVKGSESPSNHPVQLEQSVREMRFLNSRRHDNILPLYGYSLDGDEPCLVYKFMPNGSLEDRLLCRNGTSPLSWIQRHNIASGTARGLQFLHTSGLKPLIHGDIKSANILLDQNFEAQIGDFGLAREGPNYQYTHMKVSKVHGTRPYLPDEFLRSKQISTKVDTYSFGIVLFELATGLRAYDESRSRKFLKDHVECHEKEAMELMLIDRKASLDGSYSIEWFGVEGAVGCPSPDQSANSPIFNDLIRLGKWCVKKRPGERPEMVVVLQELDAMTARREITNRAQHLLRKNSYTPSNPYEIQLLHDQWLRMSPQPSPSVITRLSPHPGASPIPQQSVPASGSSSASTVPSPQIFLHNNPPIFPENPMDPAGKYVGWPPPVIGHGVLMPPRVPSVQVHPPSPVPPEDTHPPAQGAHNGYDIISRRSQSPGIQSSASVPCSDDFLPITIPGQGGDNTTQDLENKDNDGSFQNSSRMGNEEGRGTLLPLLTALGIDDEKKVNVEDPSLNEISNQLQTNASNEGYTSTPHETIKPISAVGKSHAGLDD